MKNKLNLLILGCVALAIALGCKAETSTQPSQTSAGETVKQPDSKKQPAAEVVSSIKWSDYNSYFNPQSTTTDMQKDAQWKNYQGKTVFWSGTVAEVKEGMLGGLTLSIKMNPDTLTNDIMLSLKKEQKAKAMALSKGDKISFTGKLKNYGGAFLPLTMDEGEIK